MPIGQPLPPPIPAPTTIARCELAPGWLREQRDRFATGGTLDHEATSYDLGEYRVLWDESRAGIRQLGELAGIDALPEELRRWIAIG